MSLKKVEKKIVKPMLVVGLIIGSLVGMLNFSTLFNDPSSLTAKALSTDGYPSAIEPNPCTGYMQPTSVYNMTNPSGVKSGQTWLGNTFCGSDTSDFNNRKWNSSPSGLSDIYAQPDGTVLTNTTFEESGKGLGAWKDGQIAYPGVFNEAVVTSGRAITGDGTGNISFYPRVDRGIGNSIVIGDGSHRLKSETQLANSNEVFAITGLAASNSKLYTTSSITNTIKVWNYTIPTAGLTDANQSWSIPTKPSKLVFDKNNTLWLLSDPEGSNPRLTQYSIAGTQLKQFTFPVGTVPTSIVFGDGNKAYIGDSGIDQQIKIYDVSGSSAVQTGAFGVQYGTSAGPTKGLTGPLRFRGTFNGLGMDASNNIYMTTGYGNDTTLSSYKLSDGSRNWMIESNQFQKIVAADPGSDNGNNLNFYSANLRTSFDFSKPKGKQWAAAAQVEDFDQGLNKASISVLNRFSFLTRVNGQLLTYGIDNTLTPPEIGEQLIIRKNTSSNGELQVDSGAIICNGVQSNKTLKLWRDLNNNGTKEANEISESTALPAIARKCNDNLGFHVDENSGIWKYWPTIGLIYLPLQGIDDYGNPMYSWETAKTWSGNNFPAGLNSTDPVAYGYFTFNYDVKRDIATFLINTNEATGKYKITVVDNFMKGNLTPKWTTMVPINGCGCFFRTHVSVAGDLVMLNNNQDADPASPTLNQDMDANAGRTYMWNINTGDYLGISLNDRTLFKYASGTTDAEYVTNGYQRNNGEILNIVEDVYETKTRITQIQSPVTRLTNAGANTLPARDNMGSRALATPQIYNIPRGSVSLTATASMNEGVVSKVEFFLRDITNSATVNPLETKIGEDTNGADGWNYNWDTSSLSLNNKYSVYSRASGSGTPVVNTSEPFVIKIDPSATVVSSSSSSISSASSSVMSSSIPSSQVSSTASSVVSSSSSSTSTSVSQEYKKVSDNFSNGNTLVANTYNLSNSAGTISGVSDLSATVSPAWNNNGLFYEFKVMDNTLSTNTSAVSYLQDGVELMIDTNNSKGFNYDGIDDCYFTFTYSGTGDNAFSNGQGANCSLTGTNVIRTAITGGYKMNIYIPFSAIGGTGIDNQNIGWDAQVNDSDDNLTRKGVLTLNNPNVGNIWSTPSTWSVAKLLPLGTVSSSSVAVSSSAISSTTSSSVVANPTPLNLKANLQGTYNTTTSSMRTTLKTKNLIPLTQPYNAPPFNYNGTETTTVTTMPSNTVDWILLEFKNSTGIIVGRKAALLKDDGVAVNSDGSNLTIPSSLIAGNYNIVIRHKNHLAIATNTPLNITLGTPTTIDFTTNTNVKGSNQAMLSPGVWGLKRGNANGSNAINAQDRVAIRASSDQNNVYNSLDISMDGIISSIDRIMSRTVNDGVENV